MVQNLTWSGVYLRINFSYALLRKVLKLVLLTETGPEVYVDTITTVISSSYAYLDLPLNHFKCLKIKYHPGENITEFCTEILLDADRPESAGEFKPYHFGYITHIS